MAKCRCHGASRLDTDDQVTFSICLCSPAVVTMTKTSHATNGQAPVPMHKGHCNSSCRHSHQNSACRRSQKDSGRQRAAGRIGAPAGTCIPAGPVGEAAGEAEELPKQGNAHVYSRNHPFLKNYESERDEGLGGAVAFAVNSNTAGGGFSADPDGGEGCCSGLGDDVFCCCGACDSDTECDCEPACLCCGGCTLCGDCCLPILQDPFFCIGSISSCIGDCVWELCSSCTDCLPRRFKTAAPIASDAQSAGSGVGRADTWCRGN